MSCNGKSVNLNISKSAFCHIYAHSKNIRDIKYSHEKRSHNFTINAQQNRNFSQEKTEADDENILLRQSGCQENIFIHTRLHRIPF